MSNTMSMGAHIHIGPDSRFFDSGANERTGTVQFAVDEWPAAFTIFFTPESARKAAAFLIGRAAEVEAIMARQAEDEPA